MFQCLEEIILEMFLEMLKKICNFVGKKEQVWLITEIFLRKN